MPDTLVIACLALICAVAVVLLVGGLLAAWSFDEPDEGGTDA